jgi:hypothetical protein
MLQGKRGFLPRVTSITTGSAGVTLKASCIHCFWLRYIFPAGTWWFTEGGVYVKLKRSKYSSFQVGLQLASS